ncbi:hypothetical protein CCUS01_13274 [Colletotrichum cuscutae]|uniref:Ankyrin repeat protein n=1 Tax=Colletotrichum cuscutae TaxID=1209917 RepID=A0AAI9YC66_9PEZI|nr:hypothetical protein CCUS01_13274 [Colletotrichum cuscutae]
MWTIGNKWLITTNSCLFGESDGALVQDVLDQLNKQAEYGGRKSQPGSAVEMSRLIVEHCIGSYDRRPKLEGQLVDNKTSFISTVPSVNQKDLLAVKELSIGQIYSNHMNKVGRDEIALFEAFQNWKQNGWSNSHRHARPKTGRKSSQSSGFCKDSSKALTGLLVYDDIETTIHKAYTLSNDIKDVRDELNILKSVAQYQEIVQTRLAANPVKDGELSAAYVVKNIKELDIVADRIQSAINMTLSLQQSKIANRNAVLSIQHGKVLMIFTFATLLFLPLSFLSSLFALDVSSFLQTPNWAFSVLFLVSIAISIAVGFVAFYAEDIRRNVIGVWREFMVKLTTRSKDRRHAFSSV